MDIAVVGGGEVGLTVQTDEHRAITVDRRIVVDLVRRREVEIPILPCLFPIEPVDPGLLKNGVAEEGAPRIMAGQACGMNEQRLALVC